MRCFRVAVFGLLCAVPPVRISAAAPQFVWIEAERPAWRNFEFGIDRRKPEIYSDGECFFYAVMKNDLHNSTFSQMDI